MREIRSSGSVRGVRRNPYPYRDSLKLIHQVSNESYVALKKHPFQ
jgi:hypothetical protein